MFLWSPGIIAITINNVELLNGRFGGYSDIMGSGPQGQSEVVRSKKNVRIYP